MPEEKRWEFVAAAIQPEPDAPLERTQAVGLDQAAMAQAAEMAARIDAVEKSLAGTRLFDERSIVAALYRPTSGAVIESSVLLTVTLYLQFTRQTLVYESALQRYEQRTPEERVEAGMSGSIYLSLLKRHDLARAQAILDDDNPVIETKGSRNREWAYVHGLIGTIRERSDQFEQALAHLEKAVAINAAAGTWRRIANIRADLGDRDGAIAGMLRAEAIEPLPPFAAKRVAGWLMDLNRPNEARVWVNRAEERGAQDTVALRTRLAAAQ
ncbi:MAG: hypothetical protein AAGE76_01940 [Pseudomonadota bacterium]